MVVIECPIDGCGYATGDVSEAIACVLLSAHTTSHSAPRYQAPEHSRGPQLERPKVEMGINPEEWNVFTRRWNAFVAGSGLDPANCSSQLFQCASPDLGDSLLKSYPTIVSQPTSDVLSAMKSLAVIAVAVGVARADLLSMAQSREEPFRAFAARVRGKAEICAYSTKCACTRVVDFTDCIVNDVLIAGISDLDIRREVLGMPSILEKSVNDVISLVEGKEMARNSLPSTNMAMSSFKRSQKYANDKDSSATLPPTKEMSVCSNCKKQFYPFIKTSKGWNQKPHRYCAQCFKIRRNQANPLAAANGNFANNGEIGASFSQISAVAVSSVASPIRRKQAAAYSQQLLPHQIFSKGAWRRAQFLKHPRVQLNISVNKDDYKTFNRSCPAVRPVSIQAIADSGAQSCLWSKAEFLSSGFSTHDLMPVDLSISAANKSPIRVEGAVLMRISVPSNRGKINSYPVMVYVSPDAQGFYLSWEALLDLGIFQHKFPLLNCNGRSIDTKPKANCYSSEVDSRSGDLPGYRANSCSCPKRSKPPTRPAELPFTCCPENNEKMESWLLDFFKASTFNICPHQELPTIDGPPVEVHLREGAVPKACHTPAPVPIHWQKRVHDDLLRDEALGVIERVPYGEAVQWCHRMVVTRKHDGTPRRTVDLSPLNKHCARETFSSESPFHLARRVPKGTWKTVCDAWNGYHSVPLRDSDRPLTTFITPFGRWRYKRAPQGFVSSGDGYNRRFDAVMSDFDRKERCVDDTIHFDTDLKEHWWRTIDLLTRLGNAGIVLNREKFKFARRAVNFAGFSISDEAIEPLPKYLDAIRNFPTPKSTTDIRSWFGLVNQVANYAQLRQCMAPFKPFLSPRHPFSWNSELEESFIASKTAIVSAIKHGVAIFDPSKPTCLRPDWSRQGIGYFLTQKHCKCAQTIPGCCDNGWLVVLAGSRFLSSTEERYAPIEGEALAVAWSLEQTRYFTQGCPQLIVVTDHKPLVKILGDRTLDEITNTRLFRLKQRTLPWHFNVIHLPGKTNHAADATSRHPSETSEISTLLSHQDMIEVAGSTNLKHSVTDSIAILWDDLFSATSADTGMTALRSAVENGFSGTARPDHPEITSYWPFRHSLFVVDGVVLFNDRVVVPPSLRQKVLHALHSAHQGISGMEARARATVFWPGMGEDIRLTRSNCVKCNQNAPSQKQIVTSQSTAPSTPFERIFADYFEFAGHHYLVTGDRLSGWVEIYAAPHGSNQAGSLGLQSALRSLFCTFGVPVELSSDGGPEFSSHSTSEFLKRWGIQHRMSSAYYAQSNGRAEVAVRKAKRILQDNVGRNGSLDNDKLLQALLQVRNTPDHETGLSPSEIVFGRSLRDAFSFINRCQIFHNPAIRPELREAWARKEASLLNKSLHQLTPEKLPAVPTSLKVGDHVWVQNQHGPHPNKWDKVGTIIEVRNYHQFLNFAQSAVP